MSAKDSLLATLAALKDCLNDQAVIDKAPIDVAHNLRASMLRQGLAVLTFSTVETFIRERTGEILKTLTNKRLTFSDLSPTLQKATTLGALEGVRFRLKFQPQQDKINWLMTALAPISSATTNIRYLSEHSFGYAASNLDETDIRDILKAFGIDMPWIQMTQLTSRLGMALLDCESEFQALKKRRHSSAHALTANVLHADLFNSVRSALAICLAFDLLLSYARGLLNLRLGPGQGGRAAMLHTAIQLIFVESRPGTTSFRVRKEQLPPPAPVLHRPIIRTFSDEEPALIYGAKYALKRRCHMVLLDVTSTPINWKTW